MSSGGDEVVKREQQQSISQPWAPTQPLLGGIISQLSGIGTAPTGDQLEQIHRLKSAAGNIPNFGGAGADAVTNALRTSTTPQQGLLSGSFGNLFNQLQPFASGANTDPMSNPYTKQMLATLNNDITNQVNGQFAAAGRDLSPANSQALARGLSQGEGGLLANMFQQNTANQLGAANSLFGAGGSTAGGLTGQQLAALQAQQSGINAAGMIPGLYTGPASAGLGAANTAYGLPFQNIGMLSGLVNPMAGLGGQTSGGGTSTTTQPQNTMSNVIGAGLGGIGLLGGTGAFGSSGWLAPAAAALFTGSDIRIKEDIAPIGLLHDGSNVYSYRYKGDPSGRTHIGLMAQEVEQTRPDAVAELGGVKMVDYGRATENARNIGGGLLSDLMMAA